MNIALLSIFQWSPAIKTSLLIAVSVLFLAAVAFLIFESVGKKKRPAVIVPEADIIPEDDTQDFVTEENEDFGGSITVGENQLYISYNRSFLSRLAQSDDDVKARYVLVRDCLLSYGLKSRMNWNGESFRLGKTTYAKLGIKGKTLSIYLALDPAAYSDSKYFIVDSSDIKRYEAVPLRMKLRSDRSAKWATELIAEMMQKEGCVSVPIEIPSAAPDYDTTEGLINQGLIKISLNDQSGKSAELPETSFRAIQRKKAEPALSV